MRGFIAITLMMALLFLASCSQSGSEVANVANTEGNTSVNGSDAAPKPCRETPCGVTRRGDNHEPPIGSGRGSFFLDIPFINQGPLRYDLVPGTPPIIPPYHNYVIEKSGTAYEFIEHVKVMTEQENGEVTFQIFDYTLAQNVRVNLWLAPPPSGTAGPDVIINGDGGGSVKIKGLLNGSMHPKIRRPKRFKGVAPNKSVIKWEIVTGPPDSEVVLEQDENDDMYYFYFYFGHP